MTLKFDANKIFLIDSKYLIKRFKNPDYITVKSFNYNYKYESINFICT